MDLRELGEKLREERERQGLSIDTVVERTKISRRNLQAIEEGRQEDLPHPVYSKGFIRNYARLLQIDEKEVDKVLAVTFSMIEDSAFDEDTLMDLKKSVRLHAGRKSGSRIGLAVFLLFILVAAAGVAVWLLPLDVFNRSAPVAEHAPAPAAQAPSAAPQTPAVPPQENPFPDTATFPPAEPAPQAEQSPAPAEPAPGAPDSPDMPAAPQQAAPAEPQVAAPGSPSPDAPAAVAMDQAPEAKPQAGPARPATPPARSATESEGLLSAGEAQAQAANLPTPRPSAAAAGEAKVLLIKAKEPCWIETDPESGTKREYYLLAGDTLKLDIAAPTKVKFGNTGGVSITFDGNEVATDAKSGEVKTLSFP